MGFLTFLLSFDVALALLLAGVCALMWFADRRDLARLMFCVTAVATAAATPFELGMMHARTAFEFGELLRWYHLPVFFTLIGSLLFIRYYLGTGRMWLLWTIILMRLFVLLVDFSVNPNFNFSEIANLDHIVFLGERVSVVGAGTTRAWQWLGFASVLLLVMFVVDATVQRWRKDGKESRRKALTVGLAVIAPLLGILAYNQMVVFGVFQFPIFNTPFYLAMLALIAYELGRELLVNSRARLQLAELRGQRAQVERVNSLGQLASALAHELTQPLTAIQVNLDTAEEYLRGADPDLGGLRSVMEDLRKDNSRANAILGRLRLFIRGSAMSAQVFTLDEVASDVLSLLRQEATSQRVDLKCNLPSGLPPLSGDRVHISQVILNLLVNGIEAVQSRPIGARRVILEAHASESENFEIAVRDSGPGIPDSKFEEVFSPLYTTKTAGLGVGLAISRMIVEAHGGRIWAENAVTGGAIFRFTLPQALAST